MLVFECLTDRYEFFGKWKYMAFPSIITCFPDREARTTTRSSKELGLLWVQAQLSTCVLVALVMV